MKTTNIQDMDQKTLNIFENLKSQVNAIFKHCHECSFKTRETYQERMHIFAKFLAIEYKKQNIKKISNDHLTHYVTYLQDSGLSKSYVTTSMSAIRYYYKKSVGEKFKIKSNRALGVACRTKQDRIGKNRAISDGDYAELLEITKKSGNKEYVFAVKIGRTLGLRIHEFYRIRQSQVKEAIKTNVLMVKGKGGYIRAIPLGPDEIILLQDVLKNKKSDNDRIFVNINERTHKKIKALEDYIRKITDVLNKEYTYHSLRHAYAQKLYKELRKQGLLKNEALMVVSNRLGHNRIDVVEIYLEGFE